MSEQQTKQDQSKPARDEAGRLLPGNTANPNGRPLKENTFSDIARTLLSSKEIHIEYTYPKDGALVKRSLNITSDNTINHSLVAALVKEGLDGNVNAIKELIDRTQGRAPQDLNLGGQKDNPLSAPQIFVKDAAQAQVLSDLLTGKKANES